MGVTLTIDHLVVSCERLEDGVAYVEDSFGVPMAPGGQHPQMGTHNRLLGLGGIYLEVIAVDPTVPAPDRPRWFGLERFAGPPRLTNWVARTRARWLLREPMSRGQHLSGPPVPNLRHALELAPPGTGAPMRMSRGDLVWTIAISDDGSLPFGGAFPGLIDWGATMHPTLRIPESGYRLTSFSVIHPEPSGLIASLSRFGGGLETCVAKGQDYAMRAVFSSPGCLVELS